MVPSRPRYSLVSAQGTTAYKAVMVRGGKTVELPFGPPYKPLVTGCPSLGSTKKFGPNVTKQMALQMSLIGSAGEVCTNLVVDGGRPPKPDFTITDPKGHVVEQDSFEYG